MRISLKEIAEIIDGELTGDFGIVITGVSGIKEAREGDITFIANPTYKSLIDSTQASAIIISAEEQIKADIPLIQTENPSLAFVKVLEIFSREKVNRVAIGIHASAVIGKNVQLGKDLTIQAYAVIEDNVRIGDRGVIYPGVYIGKNVQIGNNTVIYPQVSIRQGVIIGSRVIIHNGTVVGSDGFGYEILNGAHHKIPQLGTVVIEDDVEIGANVTIDRARFDKTLIGRGTKIDNLVQIAHNVVIGPNSIIVAQTGISGSVTVGKNVILAGQVGVTGHLSIGDNSIVGAQSGVTKDIPPDSRVLGSPVRPFNLALRIQAVIKRLPELFKKILNLEKKIENLERKIGKTKDYR